jgi:uncharacterized membrane protein YhaH (DUF805 family)
MNFAEVFTKDFLLTYEGRFNRARYWAFTLVYIAVAIVLNYINEMLGLAFALVALYPAICVSIKRWHDRDKSGWWVLIGLIPIIGAIWVLIECGILKGTEGPNRFGPDPLAAPAAA